MESVPFSTRRRVSASSRSRYYPQPHIGNVIVFVVVVGVVVVMIADGFCRVATPPSRAHPHGTDAMQQGQGMYSQGHGCLLDFNVDHDLDCYDWKQLWTTQG
jgi:hypothetical protein